MGSPRPEGLDLGRCWAYSDSHNDIPLLSMVGHPVAINPDTRLRRPRPRKQLAGLRLPVRTPRGHPGPESSDGRRSHLRPLAGLFPLPRPHVLSTRPRTHPAPTMATLPGDTVFPGAQDRSARLAHSRIERPSAHRQAIRASSGHSRVASPPLHCCRRPTSRTPVQKPPEQEKCPPPGRQRAFHAVRSMSTSCCDAGGASCEAACGASSSPYACDAS